jgi:hypothetical protein
MLRFHRPKFCLSVCVLSCALISSAFAGVAVNSPSQGVTVQSPVHFVATANSTCSKGISAVGVYTAPSQLAYVSNGANLDANISLGPGTYNTVVQEWDNCGWSASTPVTITVSGAAQAGVHVASPSNNSTVGSPANFVATATTGCAKGVAAMGIYTAPNVLAYVGNGASINTNLSLSSGSYKPVVVAWDNCGGAATANLAINVQGQSTGGGGGGGGTFTNLHSKGGWTGYALLPPWYGICYSCNPSGPGTTWGFTQGVSGNYNMSGNSSQMFVGGTQPYTDVLWNNHLIGDFSSQGLPDTQKTLVPSLHNFTYDVYFYGTNLSVSQALEFDLNQFFNGQGFIWGHECRIAGGNEWDIWDDVNQKWRPTGVGCYPQSNAWNHLVIQVQRTSNNQLLFKSITLNGVTNNINITENPGPAPGWYGVTVNYQQDGNFKQQGYSIWLDKLNFSYW